MEYITQLLGVQVMRAAWEQETKLPYLLTDQYRFERVELGKTVCIFVQPKNDLPTVNTLKKQMKRVQELSAAPVVLEVPSITKRRRDSFIAAQLPFVVPGKQLYLPFMAVQLTEKCDAEPQSVSTDKLQPSAQMLLFAFLLDGNRPMYMGTLAQRFDFSAMTITRAANQLVTLGGLQKSNEGVQKILTSEYSPRELYEKMRPYLINPVRKTVLIPKSEVTGPMFKAGLSALADESMLNPPSLEEWGVAEYRHKINGESNQLVDTDTQCRLEIWRYDPRKISGNNKPDVFSLAASMANETDERIQQSIEELLERMW